MAKATASARDRDVVYVVKVDVDGYRRTTLPKSAEDGEGYVSAKVALKAYDAAIVREAVGYVLRDKVIHQVTK